MQRKVLWWVVSVYSTAAEERSEERSSAYSHWVTGGQLILGPASPDSRRVKEGGLLHHHHGLLLPEAGQGRGGRGHDDLWPLAAQL